MKYKFIPQDPKGCVDDTLIALASKAGCTTSLDLQKCIQITDRGLLSLCDQMPHLESLNLSFCYKLSINAISTFIKSCHELKELIIDVYPGCNDTLFFALAGACPRLQKFQAVQSEASDEALNAFFSNMSMLQELTLHGFAKVTGSFLETLAERCPKLQMLSIISPMDARLDARQLDKIKPTWNELQMLQLAGCPHLSDEGLIALAKKSPNVKKIYLNRRNLSVAVAEIAKWCPHLEEVHVTQIDDRSFFSLAECPNLTVLDVKNSRGVTDAGLVHILQSCTHLRDLTISHCSSINPDAFIDKLI